MRMFLFLYRMSRKIKGFDTLLRILYGCDIPYEAQLERIHFLPTEGWGLLSIRMR